MSAEPIRVILNDRPLRQTLTGVGHYIAQLLTHAADVDTAARLDPFFFTYIARRDWRTRHAAPREPTPGARQPRDVGGSRKPWWLRRIMQGAYAAAFRHYARRYQLYHEPNHIPMRCALPTVTTVHDLSVIVHPEWHPPDRVRWYEAEFDAGAEQTAKFIAASEFTKGEMMSRLGIRAEKIVVTYQAPRAAFQPPPGDTVVAARAQFNLPGPFFLYVGTLEPRKNVLGLLDAYAALPSADRRACPMIVVGAWGWKQEALRARLAERRLADDVRLLGYMRDDQLAALYAACTAFVWPTLYEGFGLPPLEAMACGAPVIVSRVASLPEVVGEAGELLDPHDVDAWRNAMQRALHRSLQDPENRAAQRATALRQVARFSWRRCAEETLAVFRAVIARSRG